MHYYRPSKFVYCHLKDGKVIWIPVAAGIYKHLRETDLAGFLEDPAIVTDYTRRALQIAPWTNILREFPADVGNG